MKQMLSQSGFRWFSLWFRDPAAVSDRLVQAGWIDLVVLDRSESMNPESRAALFMNRGDGTFELMPTTFSGLDGSGICGEAADLNNDGWLDLVFAADPDNSGSEKGVRSLLPERPEGCFA
jgi:hypothetical protein